MNVGLTKRLLHHSFLEADCLDAGVAYSCRCRLCRISSATANTSNIRERILIYKSCKILIIMLVQMEKEQPQQCNRVCAVHFASSCEQTKRLLMRTFDRETIRKLVKQTWCKEHTDSSVLYYKWMFF